MKGGKVLKIVGSRKTYPALNIIFVSAGGREKIAMFSHSFSSVIALKSKIVVLNFKRRNYV